MSSCRIASCLSTYGPYKTGDDCGSFHKLLSSYRWIVGLLDTSVAGWLDGWDGCMVGPPYAVVKSRPTPRLPAAYECILLARCQETTCRNASNKEFDFAGRSVGFSVGFPRFLQLLGGSALCLCPIAQANGTLHVLPRLMT